VLLTNMNVQNVGPWQTIRVPLSDGDSGVAETLALVRQLVDEGLTDPRVRRVATEILKSSGAAQYDDKAEVRAIYEWVRRNIRFVKDMVGKEMLQPAWAILETGAGDCDCLNTILLPSLLGAVGYPTRAVTVAADPQDPKSFSHIYIEALLADYAGNPYWIPLDVARADAAWLRTPEHFYRIKRWPLMEAAEFDDAPMGRLGARMKPQYLNAYRAPQRMVTVTLRHRMPRFGLGSLGQDDGISASDLEALAGPGVGPSASDLYYGTMQPSAPYSTLAPVVVSSGPSSTFQSSTGPTISQQLTPILQAIPGIESGAAGIVAASSSKGIVPSLPTSAYPQSGTAVITASTGGSSLFMIALLGIAAVFGIRALGK